MSDPDLTPEPSPSAIWRQRLDLLGGGASRPSGPVRLAVGAVAAIATGVIVLMAVRGPPAPVELSIPLAGGQGDPAATSTTTTTAGTEVLVHAAGAVRSPGLYRLAAGARVADLIEAAGGPVDDGDLDRLNLATPVTDGQRIYVPRAGEIDPGLAGADADGGAGPDGTGGGLIDVNTATAEQLDTLPGVGPATASAILDERQRRGRFASVDDLLDVRGIGDAKLEGLRDLVRVGPGRP